MTDQKPKVSSCVQPQTANKNISHFYLSFWLLTFNFWSLITLATAPPRLPRHCVPRNDKREGMGRQNNRQALATAPPRLPRHYVPRNDKREGLGMTGNCHCERLVLDFAKDEVQGSEAISEEGWSYQIASLDSERHLVGVV